MTLRPPAKPVIISSISIYFELREIYKRSDFNLLPDLSMRRSFSRKKIFEELICEEKLTLSEIQELLSFNLERLLRQKKFTKAERFLKVFEKDLSDFFINRPVITVLCKGNFQSPDEVKELISKFSKERSLNVKPGSCEAVELLHMVLWSSLVDDFIRNDDVDDFVRNDENTIGILESFRCIAFFFGVDINIYKSTLKEIERYYRSDFRKPVAITIERWMKERMLFQK